MIGSRLVKNPRNLLWLIPAVLFVTSPLWKPPLAAFLKPRGGYDPDLTKLAERAEQNFTMDSVTITLSASGRLEWVVDAERAYTGESDKEIKMVDVDAVYYAQNGEITTIVSNKGTYFVDNRHLILTEDVVVKKPEEKQEMYSDLLHYYDDRKMVVSPGDVEIRGPNFRIAAGRMDYDLSSDGYDFSDGVRCTF